MQSPVIHPYQLLCVICRAGAKAGTAYHHAARLKAIVQAIRANPALPLRLCCNVASDYSFQNPGHGFDTPEGPLYNTRRDLVVLQKLGLVPGDTRPAIELFERVFRKIPTVHCICGSRTGSRIGWKGCRLAISGNYERGHARGIEAVLPGRSHAGKARAKTRSCRDIAGASVLHIRPHHLLCMACFHAGRRSIAPIKEDNLCEAIRAIQRKPMTPVKLVEGPCMICPPCSRYHAASNRCIGGNGMGLRDEKKDLDLLQMLDLSYGDIVPARDLYRMVFDRIRSTRQVCGHGNGKVTGYEWSVCGGPLGSQGYRKARAVAMFIPGLEPPKH